MAVGRELELTGEAMRSSSADLAAALASGGEPVSHNLHGQKLGRKGRDTRDRIIAAAAELIANAEELPVSLSAVARKASLGMTSLYNYFGDFSELLLAVLEPVMATAEEAYVEMLRERWPDEKLGERCQHFMHAYFGFWSKHSRLLHLRNSMADSGDNLVMIQRVTSTQPLIRLLELQMDGHPDESDSPAGEMATVLMTGIERTVTVATDDRLTTLIGGKRRRPEERYLRAEGRLMELVIRDMRERMRDFTCAEG